MTPGAAASIPVRDSNDRDRDLCGDRRHRPGRLSCRAPSRHPRRETSDYLPAPPAERRVDVDEKTARRCVNTPGPAQEVRTPMQNQRNAPEGAQVIQFPGTSARSVAAEDLSLRGRARLAEI